VADIDRYQYLLLMAACLAVTLPLELFFGARVYRRPGRLLLVLVPVVAVFLVWDAVAIARAHWSYNPRYTTGWELPFGVPVEELTFFVAIPLCVLLTYEAVGWLLPRVVSRFTGGGAARAPRERAEGTGAASARPGGAASRGGAVSRGAVSGGGVDA
jgi:lycopene cyclase domain-containing protein